MAAEARVRGQAPTANTATEKHDELLLQSP